MKRNLSTSSHVYDGREPRDPPGCALGFAAYGYTDEVIYRDGRQTTNRKLSRSKMQIQSLLSQLTSGIRLPSIRLNHKKWNETFVSNIKMKRFPTVLL